MPQFSHYDLFFSDLYCKLACTGLFQLTFHRRKILFSLILGCYGGKQIRAFYYIMLYSYIMIR